MSHNYPYRGSTSDTDLRPEVGQFSSANRCHISPNPNFYRPSHESFSSSSPSSSSSRGPAWAQDGALSILSSCGLEPSDLALLAELPEDVLTVESLPHVLKQIKGKRGAVSGLVPRTLSPPSSYSSSYHPAPGSSSRVWGHLRSQTLLNPLDHVAPSSLPYDQDRWRNSRTSSSVRPDPTAPPAAFSSSRYAVDFHRGPGPSEYGKTGRSGGPLSSQDCSSFSSAGQERRSRPTGFSEPRSAPPSDMYHPKPRVNHREDQTSSTRNSSQQPAAASTPSEKEALDFHGTCPTVFPYSCSLCDITVLSEMVWLKHINNSQHAEGQLSLLQQFPNWDCRVESVSRAKIQEKRKDEEKSSCSAQRGAQNEKSKTETKSDRKPSEKGKVVCVKFPPQSVDEMYLRKLTEPFGKIVKILMFPSLAFLELSSNEQAKELVKFHVNYPPAVNGKQMEFSISNTFSFLQSSQVVSFTPVPTGGDGQLDLISIVKRFGPPHYYLFLPSVAYVEMEHAADAQKLVDYYSSNTLRINNACVKVSFSGEYKTLVRVPSAKKYEEQKASTKRTRSSSRDKELKGESKRRQSSKDQEQEQRKSNTERSRSREWSRKDRRSRSSDKCTRSPSKSNEKPNREVRSRSRERSSRGTRSRSRERSDTERKTRSRSRDKSKERSSRGSRTRSRSREKPNKDGKTRSSSTEKSSNGSKGKSVEGEKTQTESRAKEEPAPWVEAADTQTEEKAKLSTEDSDIEGMEVIGEDEENVEVESHSNVEETETAESPEEDKQMEATAGNEGQKDDVCEMKKPEGESESITEAELEDGEEESDFPVDLENCITLDELEDNQSDNQGEDVREAAGSLSSRVIHFRDLPTSVFSDAEFIGLVSDHGKAVRYLVLRQRQEGFIEMWSSAEAQRAAQELIHKPVTLNGCRIFAKTSHKYQRLSNGWEIHEQRRSKAPDGEETYSKSDRTEEASKAAPGRLASERELSMTERERGANNTTEEESLFEKTQRETSKDKHKRENVSDPNKESEGEKEGLMEETPDSAGASPTPQTEQKPENDDQLQDSGSVQTGGAAEPEIPSRPVGTEFVRPVVGYFCNLCQLIYADEAEAKRKHCSSLTHYRKYQEKTGKDPWSS